jgi:hypothetical protein
LQVPVLTPDAVVVMVTVPEQVAPLPLVQVAEVGGAVQLLPRVFTTAELNTPLASVTVPVELVQPLLNPESVTVPVPAIDPPLMAVIETSQPQVEKGVW